MKSPSPYVWPAEWEPQAATWIAWPHNLETWPERFAPVPYCFAEFIETLSQVQPVHVLAGPDSSEPSAKSMLRNKSNVFVHVVNTNDAWIRDYGPTFVRQRSDGKVVGVDWKFNAWGGKYPPFDQDAQAAEKICRILGVPRSISAMYCEGGGLETDGQGTLLTTASCLLAPTRNPGWSLEMIETELSSQLGVSRIVWVDGGGLQGDDTDGHIDQLARFVAPGIVVAAVSSVEGDSNRVGLEQNVEILRRSVDAKGSSLEVHELPTPPPRFVSGKRVPESYCNFLFANGVVIVPTFRTDRCDQFAIDLISRLVPDRKVIPLDAYHLIWGLGAFHCASQQQPTPASPSA